MVFNEPLSSLHVVLIPQLILSFQVRSLLIPKYIYVSSYINVARELSCSKKERCGL